MQAHCSLTGHCLAPGWFWQDLLLAGYTLSLLSMCKEGCVEAECIVGTGEAKAKEMAPLDGGKET